METIYYVLQKRAFYVPNWNVSKQTLLHKLNITFLSQCCFL